MSLLKKIDGFLDSITMYRLVLYGLFLISILSIVFGFLEILPFPGLDLLISFVVINIGAFAVSKTLSWTYKVPENVESPYITSLILFLIVNPQDSILGLLLFLAIVSIAIASKYVISYKGKHIFNPAAIAVVIVGAIGVGEASWWVGSSVLLLPVLVVGLSIVRKLRRFDLFFAFLIASSMSIYISNLGGSEPAHSIVLQALASWPIFFLATIMLTEPQTTPPQRWGQVSYGVLVGALFGAQFGFGPIYSSPELALVIGNIFSYIISPRYKLILKFKEKNIVANGVYDFAFSTSKQVAFSPGQYFEWTLPHRRPDSRGVRRFFTIASSPTENELRIGVRIDKENESSFKRALLNMKDGDEVVASGLSGTFNLPRNKKQKMVFIAGGIGITPYRSMLRYMLDRGERRDIVLFYAAADPLGFAYKDLLSHAQKSLGVKVVYVLSGINNTPYDWRGRSGRITPEMMREEVPDFRLRLFYLSGPNAMVEVYEKMLREMGVPRRSIVTDYFPGY